VLDVGAGSGEFLFVAHNLGYEAAGVEPNVDYATFCRDELGLPVRTASIEDLHGDASTYDFIRLNHVLEHLRDPSQALERIAERLSPDGILYVEVPNICAYAASKSKGGIFHYGHISNFSAWTLRAAAGQAGLVEVEETTADMKGGTSVFFRKGQRWSREEAINRENAHIVRAALDAHASAPFSPGAKVARLWSKGASAFASMRIASSMGDPRSIGRHYLGRLPAEALAPRASRVLTPSQI
jgi:SAM-dependent methyltransferase